MTTLATVYNRYKQGSIYGDILRARLWANDSEAASDALERLAARLLLVWKLYGDMKRLLLVRADEEGLSPQAMKHQLLKGGAALALTRRSEPQTHRFGQSWRLDKRGHRLSFEPRDLNVNDLWRWFRAESIKAAKADLMDLPYPSSGRDSLDDALPMSLLSGALSDANTNTDPEDWLLQAHEAMALLSRTEYKLVDLLQDDLSITEAAERIGCSRATADVLLSRARKRVKNYLTDNR